MAPTKPVKVATKPANTKISAAKTTISRKATQNQAPTIRPPKKEKPQKQIFKGLVMSFSGTFINLGKPEPHEQVAKWVRVHGAQYEREVTELTTHLICSIEDYKKKTSQVKKAWDLGPKCHIVVFDWLVDCLIGPKLTKRLRNERGYTLDRTIRKAKKGKNALAAYREKFEQGVRISKELCNSRLNHIYYDPDGFEYKIVLTRVTLGEKVTTEKYTLFLFESNAKPCTYMCGAKFSRQYRPTSWYGTKCYPMTFFDAFAVFKHFFTEKTGIEWDMRCEKGISTAERPFVYTPPVLGRPIGLMPHGYVRPEFREEVEEGLE
ncbi:hypothetical protein LSUE1_G006211, partial [Lachnellula suecica]